jgi:hypothetical protein
MEDPREDHWTAMKRLLRYVKGMLDQAIIFPKHGGKGGLCLTVFSEASPKQRKVSQSSWFSAMQIWRATSTDERSTSGALVFLGAAPIAWQSLKQKIMVLLTCEAEYVAAATAACQAVWLRRLLSELTGKDAHLPALMVDNQPAIVLTKTLSYMTRASTLTSSSTSSGTASMEGRSPLSSSRPVDSSLTSSPSHSGACGLWS